MATFHHRWIKPRTRPRSSGTVATATRLGSRVESDHAAAMPRVPDAKTSQRCDGQAASPNTPTMSAVNMAAVASLAPQRSAARPTTNCDRAATTKLTVAYQAITVLLAPAASSSRGTSSPIMAYASVGRKRSAESNTTVRRAAMSP